MSSEKLIESLSRAFQIAQKDLATLGSDAKRRASRALERLRELSDRAAAIMAKENDAEADDAELPVIKVEKLVIKKRFATSSMDRTGHLRPVSLMQELQAVADIHATMLGVGRTFCFSANISWVLTHNAFEIVEMPDDKEELSIITWPSAHETLRAIRDFEIRGADNRVLVRSTSQWIMMDLAARKPVKLADYLPVWECVPERALNIPFEKIAEFEPGRSMEFAVRFDDIDMNQHVNNAVYALWAQESMGFDFLAKHRLVRMEINFKKEIPAGVKAAEVGVIIDSQGAAADTAGDKAGTVQTRHLIQADGAVRAIAKCVWAGV